MRDTLASIAAHRPGKIVQVCYTVADIDKAALAWAADGVGPFYRARFELDAMIAAHRGWDGRDPLRPYAALQS